MARKLNGVRFERERERERRTSQTNRVRGAVPSLQYFFPGDDGLYFIIKYANYKIISRPNRFCCFFPTFISNIMTQSDFSCFS